MGWPGAAKEQKTSFDIGKFAEKKEKTGKAKRVELDERFSFWRCYAIRCTRDCDCDVIINVINGTAGADENRFSYRRYIDKLIINIGNHFTHAYYNIFDAEDGIEKGN